MRTKNPQLTRCVQGGPGFEQSGVSKGCEYYFYLTHEAHELLDVQLRTHLSSLFHQKVQPTPAASINQKPPETAAVSKR